jgi:hypothetical protein
MWLLLYKVLNEFVDSGISMDSNKLVEKFGIPQFVQHHDASDPAKQLYIEYIDLHVLYFLSSKMAMKMKMSKRLIALYIMILLLTKCHYPEPNPGPRTPWTSSFFSLFCSFYSFGDDAICSVPGLSGECMWLLLYKVLNDFVKCIPQRQKIRSSWRSLCCNQKHL